MTGRYSISTSEDKISPVLPWALIADLPDDSLLLALWLLTLERINPTVHGFFREYVAVLRKLSPTREKGLTDKEMAWLGQRHGLDVAEAQSARLLAEQVLRELAVGIPYEQVITVYAARRPAMTRVSVRAGTADLAARRRLVYLRWHPVSPAARAHGGHLRRARLLGLAGTFAAADWRAVCAFYGNRCLRCGCRGPLTLDHVIPVSKGGRNDTSNFQPLCFSCNVTKGTRTDDYRPHWM